MVDILVLGATGFTGRLIVRYLHQHPQRQKSSSAFTFAIAGRSSSKLNELVISLGLGSDVEAIVVDTSNYDDVEKAVTRSKVVINCVGPFWKYSFGVVRACAANGIHYVDITGETHFVQEIIARYDYLAYKHSSIIIPSCGLDSLPSDIIAYVAASSVRKALASPPGLTTTAGITEAPSALIATSLTSFKIQNFAGPSAGSLGTMINMLEEVPSEVMRKTRSVDCLSPVKKPTSILNGPSLVYSLVPRSLTNVVSTFITSSGHKHPFSRWGSFIVLAPHDRAMVMRSWGLFERESAGWSRDTTLHLGADAIASTNAPVTHTYGPDFMYNEFAQANGPFRALVTSLVWLGSLVALVILPPLRWLLKRTHKPGEGPSEEEMGKTTLLATNITTTVPIKTDIHKSEKPCIVKTTLETKKDPGYTGSAIMSSESALALLDRSTLPLMALHGGVLTPATALGDVIVKRLKKCGFWDVESELVQHPDDE